MEKLMFWLSCTRAYALPMSITAWSIPFVLGCLNNGNIIYGLVALIGIICVHLGANLFDDIIDYKNYLKHVKNIHYKEQDSSSHFETNNNNKKSSFENIEIKETINLKKGKCQYFIEKKISTKTALAIALGLFAIASILGLFFAKLYGLPIILVMLITGVLCIFYPKSGYYGLSEIIIGTIYSPLLFSGVYYVMTGQYSSILWWLSFSFALVTITLLYTDFFLDYNSDKKVGKKTLCILSGNKKNAYNLYVFILFLIYSNIFLGIHSHVFSTVYFIIFLSIFNALDTLKKLQIYIDKEIKNEQEFMDAMNTTQKFIAIFTILCLISFYYSNK